MVLLNMEIIDDLKCCGNCKSGTKYSGMCNNEQSDGFVSQCVKKYCKHWEQDNFKQKDRKEL